MSGTILRDDQASGGTGRSATQYATNHAAWVYVKGSDVSSPYTNATALSGASGNVAAASAVATLTSAVGVTAYITGATITGAGATSASVVSATITGLLGGTLTYTVAVPAGVSVGIPPIVLTFNPPMPASATNTNIVVTLPSLGSGNTNASVTATGFKV